MKIDKSTEKENDELYGVCFEQWGINNVAYIKKSVIDNKEIWTIYAAEGTPVGYAENLASAQMIIKQNDLEPFTAH